ncbi:MAG: deoxyguanosinetriphosphate triphosphohydrolase family protein [Candidatus Spyradosoma sp.]
MSQENMQWTRLLSSARWTGGPASARARGAGTPPTAGDSRNPFERDYGRVLYSSAFRRLQDKTQVFPLGRNDYVRTRLTHSLEVSYVGRSLGEALGDRLAGAEEFAGTPAAGSLGARVGAAVASACLAHDVGNPPFGHAGEKAIEEAFKRRGHAVRFEGNAQGLRLLTKIGGDSIDGHGLQPTAGTLGAFMKYPCTESFWLAEKNREIVPANRLECKKFSVADTEADVARFVRDACGLIPRDDAGTRLAFARHPLAFLVEAADDLCYLVADMEDSFNAKIVSYDDARHFLSAFWKHEDAARRERVETRLREMEARRDLHGAVNFMRATAIGGGIRAATEAFDANEGAILAGTFEKSLFEASRLSEEMASLRAFSLAEIYRARVVGSVELMGFQVMQALADFFLDWAENPGSAKGEKIASVFRFRDEAGTPEGRVREAVDYISGMTDSFALATYRRLCGISDGGNF